MPKVWHFFMKHWVAVYWVWIIIPFSIIGIWIATHEVLFRIERRRYQRASKP